MSRFIASRNRICLLLFQQTMKCAMVKDDTNSNERLIELQMPVSKKPTAFLLPPYDEYIIAYADRSAVTKGELKKSNLFENGFVSKNHR